MTAVTECVETANGQAIPLVDVPVVTLETMRQTLQEQLGPPRSVLSALFGVPNRSGSLRIYAVTSSPITQRISICASDVEQRYPALTREVTQAHWFERELAEQWGVVPAGHPWLKPIRFHSSYDERFDAWGRTVGDQILPCVQPAGTDYFKVHGDEIHEVAVGPVHAGVIEPGHFRFQCHGERVFTLEIELGYQHRGIERKLVGGPDKRTLHYMETLAGDTTIGHATAYAQAIEGLSGVDPPMRGLAIRALALELERLANHTGDLGALAGDVGFLPTLSYCGRLRGDFLNASGLLCGSRFGRGLVRPGGVAFDIDSEMCQQLLTRIAGAHRDVNGAVDLLWSAASVLSRFEVTGTVPTDTSQALGLVGMAARAAGIDRDIRRDFPTGFAPQAAIPISTWPAGDVYGRAWVRHQEIKRACEFLLEQLPQLPPGPIRLESGPLQRSSIVVSLVEAWRGEICHVAVTGEDSRFAHYKVVDPSFHNWIGLAMSLRDQQISDFPLCNKSFNLSYCGHDL